MYLFFGRDEKENRISTYQWNKEDKRYFFRKFSDFQKYEDYFEVFDSLAQTNLGWENNPNSGNEIKLWVFNSPNF